MRTPRRRLALSLVAMGAAASLMHFHVAQAQTWTTLAAAPAASWKKLNPAVSPSPRAATAMAYDPVSRRVVFRLRPRLQRRRGRQLTCAEPQQ